MMTRRSTGKTRIARSLWYAAKGAVELRLAPLPRPKPGEALVRTLFSGISRGTERLVFSGAILLLANAMEKGTVEGTR
jgi:hypothetical protein